MEKNMDEVVDDGWGRHRADDEVIFLKIPI